MADSRCRHPGRNTANAAGFHQKDIDSLTIALYHLAIDGDLTDIYLNENLGDYNFKYIHFTNLYLS